MGLSISYDNPSFEKGTEIDVGGFLVKNGEAVDVSDEDAAIFAAKNGRTINEAFDGNAIVKVSGSANADYDPREADRKAEAELDKPTSAPAPTVAGTGTTTTTPPGGGDVNA